MGVDYGAEFVGQAQEGGGLLVVEVAVCGTVSFDVI